MSSRQRLDLTPKPELRRMLDALNQENAEVTGEATSHDAAAPADSPADDGWEWAIVEIFGHRRHAGRTREEERFGAKMLRIDVPIKGDPATHGWITHFYGGSAIFSFSLTDEATALRINRPYERPALLRRTEQHETTDGGFSEWSEDVE